MGGSPFPHVEVVENALVGTHRAHRDDSIAAQQKQRISRHAAAVPEDLVVLADPRGGRRPAQRGLEAGIDVPVDEAKLGGGFDLADDLIDGEVQRGEAAVRQHQIRQRRPHQGAGIHDPRNPERRCGGDGIRYLIGRVQLRLEFSETPASTEIDQISMRLVSQRMNWKEFRSPRRQAVLTLLCT